MTTLALDVTDPSHVAEARRVLSAAAEKTGAGAHQVAQLALVATELATNLLKHGRGGQLVAELGEHAVSVLALDRGPGMADIAACLVDGYSTAGSRGAGLGAVRRIAQHFEVVSWPGRGTAILATLAQPRAVGTPGPEAVYALALPKRGEQVSGDGWHAHADATGLTLFLIDGLGHGSEAAVAAHEGLRRFDANWTRPPTEILAAVHRGLGHTRGGAAAVARLSWTSGTITFAGLGNIVGCCLTPDGGVRRMVSLNGIAGHNARKLQAFEYPCPRGLVLMHSDGLATSWNLGQYPGLLQAHPLLIAGVLYRDFSRGSDDVTIVATRVRAA